jgi:hypothetical protein
VHVSPTRSASLKTGRFLRPMPLWKDAVRNGSILKTASPSVLADVTRAIMGPRLTRAGCHVMRRASDFYAAIGPPSRRSGRRPMMPDAWLSMPAIVARSWLGCSQRPCRLSGYFDSAPSYDEAAGQRLTGSKGNHSRYRCWNNKVRKTHAELRTPLDRETPISVRR